MKAHFALNKEIRVYSILLLLALINVASGITVYANDTSEKSTDCLLKAESEDAIKDCLFRDFTDIKTALAKSLVDPNDMKASESHTEASATASETKPFH